ncbi:50S ribosomal protein L11 methyltransferase [Rhodovulum sp. DZ06]|uniref:50S ribosomal protein L11 methyltransferase n=1 Tax=Rhodovulum sp. DZ06 TaxID=3425126 RepID=UPI003D351E6C
MTTWTALTTIPGEKPAYALGEAMEELAIAPHALAVLEIEDGSGLWEVGGYYGEKPDEVQLDILAAMHGAKAFAVSKLEDRDWVAQVRRELTPVEAGRFVVHGAHDRDGVDSQKLSLEIEAAMAFGTGHHGTTRGCLLALDGLIRQGWAPRRVADIGCGTGVLAMGAAKALRVPCVATDIDPVAVRTARANVKHNGLSPWVRTGLSVGFRSPLIREAAPFDLVFANILARPLRGLAKDMFAHIAPGGHAVLSGILNPQATWVESCYLSNGFVRSERIVLGDWTTLVLRKPPLV